MLNPDVSEQIDKIKRIEISEMNTDIFATFRWEARATYARQHGNALFLSLVVNREEMPENFGGFSFKDCDDFVSLLVARETGALVYYDPPGTITHSDRNFIHKRSANGTFSVCDKKEMVDKPTTLSDAVRTSLDADENSSSFVERLMFRTMDNSCIEDILVASAEIDVMVSAQEQFRMAALYGATKNAGRVYPCNRNVDEELFHHLTERIDLVSRRAMRASSHLLKIRAALASGGENQGKEANA